MKLVELVQFIWYHVIIPTYMGWTILVLIPKGNADTQGIGILWVLCKVMEAIIDTCIKRAKTLHDVLHGFLEVRGTGTSIMELNIVQYL